jgi:hypothetical protein
LTEKKFNYYIKQMEANRKRVQVHMLPTENKTNIVLFPHHEINILQCYSTKGIPQDGIGQHLYFTTDTIPKFNHPRYNVNGNRLEVWDADDMECLDLVSVEIIASTDPKLTIECTLNNCLHDGMNGCYGIKPSPQPSQAFIEAYCKQGGIDEALVEYELNQKRINPPMQLKLNPDNTIIIHPVEEKMYSREEVIAIAKKAADWGYNNPLDNEGEITDKWIEENL